ncbi:competence protein ComFA [Alteribacillus persepolensis]|uniref:Competence protein ComFA n=1 Tax=Alteribacillus persepolensis TaxID=568899 RepID=A0A1G8AEM6_9BACI|nr:DEAD/DEAH box helicase [Alteribacillus persepolensis]SDH19327.1 competence protein ComFA [Alteribacillus persepolensis]
MHFCHVRSPQTGQIICLPESLAEKASIVAGPAVISELPLLPFPSPVSEEPPLFAPDIRSVLYGKELLLDELPFTIHELAALLQSQHMTIRSGLKQTENGFCCQRCHNSAKQFFGVFPCARCGQSCVYCRHCLMMGRISACSALFRWNGPAPPISYEAVCTWEGTFSPGQAQASRAIISTIIQKGERLIWAVCGAGKTEILFPGIEHALQNGGRVLLATPRTDVVVELLPRLQAVFPKTDIIGLYGKSEDKQKTAPLVIATTHQTMRFADAFDTVIIDEVDAFPFSQDKSLVQAVAKAKKQHAALIYLTATPTPALKKRVKNKQLPVTKIPRRFHGYPLPVPRFKWCGYWQKRLENGKLPHSVERWCASHIATNTPAFLFVPSVNVLWKTTEILQKTYPSVMGVHSEDEERQHKVAAFRKGEIPLLVTTTILERGVTVAGVEAAVFGAEAEVFTESALVQIAGRTGRKKETPAGDVVFFHAGKTRAMLDCRRHITAMNEEDAEGGKRNNA